MSTNATLPKFKPRKPVSRTMSCRPPADDPPSYTFISAQPDAYEIPPETMSQEIPQCSPDPSSNSSDWEPNVQESQSDSDSGHDMTRSVRPKKKAPPKSNLPHGPLTNFGPPQKSFEWEPKDQK